MSEVFIRTAIFADIPSMVNFSYIKRRDYEKAQPQFWKYADGAEEIQKKWFEELLIRDDHIMLVAENNEKIIGFIVGKIMSAPEVYDPDGLTLMIDDFCVDGDWNDVGEKLISKIKIIAKNVSQILVVCGAHDEEKRNFLKKNINLTIASEWYVGEV